MKHFALALIAVTLPFTGCGKKPAPPAPQVVTEAADTDKAEPAADTEHVAQAPDSEPAPGAEVPPTDAPKPEEAVIDWMSWDGGVDVTGMTKEGLAGPNVIFHVARVVHTPAGSAPSGMILYQPDPAQPPIVAGFVSGDDAVGAYFGPKIFAGTPFEKAPAQKADITVTYDAATGTATATATVGEHKFKATLSNIGAMYRVDRPAGPTGPFYQQGVEAKAGAVALEVDGAAIALTALPGAPLAVWAPTGVYSR